MRSCVADFQVVLVVVVVVVVVLAQETIFGRLIPKGFDQHTLAPFYICFSNYCNCSGKIYEEKERKKKYTLEKKLCVSFFSGGGGWRVAGIWCYLGGLVLLRRVVFHR